MENQYSTRRDFLKQAGAGLTALLTASGCASLEQARQNNREIKEILKGRKIESIFVLTYLGDKGPSMGGAIIFRDRTSESFSITPESKDSVYETILKRYSRYITYGIQ